MASSHSKKSDDLVRKALLLGFGFMDISKEKMNAFIKEVKKDHNITKSDSRKAVKDFAKELERQKKTTIKAVRKHADALIQRLEKERKRYVTKKKRR